MSCDICAFNNPKPTVTAIIIKDGKILALRRKQEPFIDQWDLPGGFINANETTEEALRRELKEELDVEVTRLSKIGEFTGTYVYQRELPILNFGYLVEIAGDITLNEESHTWAYVDPSVEIAFDSNKKLMERVKIMLEDITRVRELTKQLDDSAVIDEYTFYEAQLNGTISRIHDDGKLIGMGWAFPRQTMLRKQAVVEDMIVDDAYRGKGLGKQILLKLIENCKAQKVEVMELTTNPKREAANALYKKVGFELHPTNHYLYKL